jgi:hypothetical protein
MASDWQDMNELTPINGWYTFRTRSISAEGVSDIVVLTLVDQHTDDHYRFVMSPDVSLRCGYDLVGDGAFINEYDAIEEEL